jgi:Immunoglobulin-like domain of bacterial spore germination
VKRAALLALFLALATGCGADSSSSPPETTTPPATATNPHMPVPPLALTVYKTASGTLAPTVVHVPRTRAVAAAALQALGVDAPVTISGGTATVGLDRAPDDQVAEIVFTLTQFPTVQRVDVAGRSGLTREDFAHYVPPILVDTPAAGGTVTPAFTVAGSASVFEATVVVQLVRDGEVLSKQTVTASEGAPARGSFSTTAHATPGALTVQVYAPSAEDGSPQHEVDIPVTVSG